MERVARALPTNQWIDLAVHAESPVFEMCVVTEARESSEVLFCFPTVEKQVYGDT